MYLEMYAIKETCMKNDIDFFPSMLNQLIKEKETNKIGNDLAIEMFTKYLQLEAESE